MGGIQGSVVGVEVRDNEGGWGSGQGGGGEEEGRGGGKKKKKKKKERKGGGGGEKMIQDPSKKPVNLNEKGWPALEQESNDLTAGAQFTRSESPDDQMSADV